MQLQIRRKARKYISILRPTFKVGIFFLLFFIILKLLTPIYNFSKQNNLSREFFANLLLDKNTILKKFQNRTNIILLGIPGGNHDGSDLTDSIIFLSIDFQKKDIIELSIPRDIWSETLKDKINTAYHYGEVKKQGGGLILAKAEIEEIIGQPIHYAWLIDFSGFKEIINLVGGVDINVETSFTDEKYPIEGKENDFCGGDPNFTCRYEKLIFRGGLQHMDGERALKFVRSRQAVGTEGSDFARGKRQQLVISALKNILVKPSFYLKNAKKAKELFSAYTNTVDTDMNLSEQILFFKSFLKIPSNNIKRLVLDEGDKENNTRGFLINPPLWQFNGEWVLTPRTGNFDEIHQYIICNIENPNCIIKP